jgi:hypothetical protein
MQLPAFGMGRENPRNRASTDALEAVTDAATVRSCEEIDSVNGGLFAPLLGDLINCAGRISVCKDAKIGPETPD